MSSSYERVYTRDADGNVTKVERRDAWLPTWAPTYETLAEFEYDLVDRMTKSTRYVDPLDRSSSGCGHGGKRPDRR